MLTIPIIQRGFSLNQKLVVFLTSLISTAEKSPTFSTPKSQLTPLCVMRKMNSNDKLTIKNQTKLLLKIFGGISIVVMILVIIFGESSFEKTNFIYPILFTISMTIFGLMTLFLINYFKKYREIRFFKKEPYSEINKRTIEFRNVTKSKYDFSQTQRIIEIRGKRFMIEYYDDFFKLPISDVLLVFNESEPQKEPKVINYKKKKYELNEIFEIISG